MANALTDAINSLKSGVNAANVLAPLAPQAQEKLANLEAEARQVGEDIKEGATIYAATTLTLQAISTIAVCVIAAVAYANYNRKSGK